MARQVPPNPYAELRLNALGEVLSDRAGDLLEGRQVGRRDVAYLLIAAAAAVRPRRAHPGDPSRLVAQGELSALEGFSGVLHGEQRALRHWVIRQALDALGGREAGPALDVLLAQAQESDEGCLAALEALERLPPARG